MYLIAVIAVGFGLVAAFALVAYFTGESVRREQAAAVEEYVAKRREVLELLRQKERAEQEKQQKLEEEQGIPDFALSKRPEDRKLTEDLHFVKQVAHDAPAVFAAVVKHYVRREEAT